MIDACPLPPGPGSTSPGGGGQPDLPMVSRMPTTPSRAHPKPKTRPWTRPNPKPPSARGHLSTAQKDAAQQRADEAGRRYPNLVDNMWASRHLAKDGSPKA